MNVEVHCLFGTYLERPSLKEVQPKKENCSTNVPRGKQNVAPRTEPIAAALIRVRNDPGTAGFQQPATTMSITQTCYTHLIPDSHICILIAKTLAMDRYSPHFPMQNTNAM